MNAFASYQAINTKLHIRRRALLHAKEWMQISQYKSVAQLSDFLRQRESYAVYLNKGREEEVHRADLELMLHRYVASEIEKMLNYFSGEYKQFFKLLLMEFDIYDLQLVLREVVREENILGIDTRFVHSRKYTKINYNKVLASQSITQLIDALKGTPYFDVLKTTTQEDVMNREFHMEMKLYMLYYKMLMEKAKKLSARDTDIIEKVIGKRIDLLNIQWIYRATKYYSISKEEILIYSLPGGTISYNRLKKLIYAKSLETFKQEANKYLAAPLFKAHQSDTFLIRRMDQVMYQAIKQVKGTNNIGMPLAYIYQLQIEINNLIAVTEGIRYGLPEEELKKYLVLTVD